MGGGVMDPALWNENEKSGVGINLFWLNGIGTGIDSTWSSGADVCQGRAPRDIWDGDERFLTYANTDLQLSKMFIAILCLNGVEQPFKSNQCPFFLPLRRRKPRLRRGSLRPRGGRRTQPPPPGSAPGHALLESESESAPVFQSGIRIDSGQLKSSTSLA